ncbi:MAG: hypothetical protein RL272_696 [Candidatus Parcubacteria bacterium]|jgi:peptidoglycan/xylan/chitin deacetylase (PgdA/CDA1 family)
MPPSRPWKRRLIAAAAVLAAPALVFLTFDSLLSGGDASVGSPALVETFGRAARSAGAAVSSAGERLRAAEGAGERAAADPPPAPVSANGPAPARPAAERLKVPILVYHNIKAPEAAARPADLAYYVTPEEFEAQAAYLESEGYSAISTGDLRSALLGSKPLPPKPVMITFDDDRESQFQNAFPSLQRHHLTATFYVFTNAIGRPGYFTWEQLRTLRDAGMSIESHSIFHPYLEKLDDAALRAEVTGSKAAIEKELGIAVDSFAYPFGTHPDRVIAAVRDAGYATARTLRHSAGVGSDELLLLPGYIVTGDFSAFRQILAGMRK